MSTDNVVLGIIGGSGLYDIPELEVIAEHDVETPFGAPSAPVVEGRLEEHTVFFLPRHGKGHVFTPSEVPYRANVFALKQLGITALLGVSAVGSLQEDVAPGHLVIPDQVVDRTRGRPGTFFGEGIVAHVAMADPYCTAFAARVADAARSTDAVVHRGGTLMCMEGPQFSTRAESFLYRAWGATLIGMTVMPEAKLAREASLCYATLALATDYDCWHDDHDAVTVDAVMKVMARNSARAKQTIVALVQALDRWECDCPEALRYAVVTRPDRIAPAARERLAPLLKGTGLDKAAP